MSKLVPDSFRPLLPVQEPYCPGAGVHAWRATVDGAVVQEIVLDIPDGYMVRYVAWTNFPGADNVPRHIWWAYSPPQPSRMATVGQASMFANESAKTYGITFGTWVMVKMP